MARLEILEFPDPRLRTVAKPVEVFDSELNTLTEDLLETMYEARGIGLAASQVNVHQRVLVVDVSEDQSQPLVVINPQIAEKTGEQIYEEGCLSVPGIYAKVTRAENILLKYQNVSSEQQELKATGLLAICLQHEMDHLAGKLFVDYLSPLKRKMVQKKLEKQRRTLTQKAG